MAYELGARLTEVHDVAEDPTMRHDARRPPVGERDPQRARAGVEQRADARGDEREAVLDVVA